MTENTTDGIGFAIGMAGILAGALVSRYLFPDADTLLEHVAALACIVTTFLAPLFAYRRWTFRRR